jgi:hypothetical protein
MWGWHENGAMYRGITAVLQVYHTVDTILSTVYKQVHLVPQVYIS